MFRNIYVLLPLLVFVHSLLVSAGQAQVEADVESSKIRPGGQGISMAVPSTQLKNLSQICKRNKKNYLLKTKIMQPSFLDIINWYFL